MIGERHPPTPLQAAGRNTVPTPEHGIRRRPAMSVVTG
jgi:hypothetical protein